MDTLQVIFEIVSIIGVGVLVWYTFETWKIRKVYEKQLLGSSRPYIGYIQDPQNFTVKNFSNNIALNIFLLTKIDGHFKISKDSESASAIAPGTQYTFTRADMYTITKDELSKRVPAITKYLDFMLKHSAQCIGVIYEDINENKLYTIHYGSGDAIDKAGTTGYIKEIYS